MLGAPVRDPSGSIRGRVREIAIAPQEHATSVAYLIVRTPEGERMLPASALKSCGATVWVTTDAPSWERYTPSDGVLLLKRDLLDQQIIDVHGRKVVRVNDVEFDATPVNSHMALSVVAVDVGARGAIRRLAKGIVPSFTLRALLEKIPPRVIPWQYVDLIETDPARRVKLKIAYEGLSKLHPADIADIVEDLPAAERERDSPALRVGAARAVDPPPRSICPSAVPVPSKPASYQVPHTSNPSHVRSKRGDSTEPSSSMPRASLDDATTATLIDDFYQAGGGCNNTGEILDVNEATESVSGWAASAASSRPFCSASSATGWGWCGRASCCSRCPRSPSGA